MRQLIATCSTLELWLSEPKMSPPTSATARRVHLPRRASSVYIQRRQPVPASWRSVCWATHSSTPMGVIRSVASRAGLAPPGVPRMRAYPGGQPLDLLQGGPAEDPRGAHEH